VRVGKTLTPWYMVLKGGGLKTNRGRVNTGAQEYKYPLFSGKKIYKNIKIYIKAFYPKPMTLSPKYI
jgi:hypothetical protein